MRSVKHPDYPDYTIYENGDVINDKTGERPRRVYIKYKFPGVSIRTKRGGHTQVKLKDLILEAFSGGINYGYEAHCIDRNEENVCLDNLEWRSAHIKRLNNRILSDKYFKIVETGEVYYNVYAYIQQKGLVESRVLSCLRSMDKRLPDGTHFEFVDYNESED